MYRTAAIAEPLTTQRTAALVVDGLCQRYGPRLALGGVSWQAQAGEVVCLLGHSGCGKTTLLRLIAGIEPPTAGRVLLDGEEMSGASVFIPAEQRRVGLVFQDYALFPHLSVLANVAFGLAGHTRAERDTLALAALQRVGMAVHAQAYPHMLSGGEQQRVALARALAPQPRVLLMDEPFSNLDRRLRDRVRDNTMTLLRESGTTAVVVTHDPEEALRIADRIVLMHAGQVEQQGSPEFLYHQPVSLFAARFFCDVNEIPGVCTASSVVTPLGRFAAPGSADGSAVQVCLRPQDIGLAASTEGIAATVLQRVFLGDGEQLRVAVPGLTQPLRLRLQRGSGLRAGDVAVLDIRRSAALVFPNPISQGEP